MNRGTQALAKRNHSMEADAHWHLDKRVPVAIILTLLLQTGGIIWWAASATERISNLEKRADMAAPQADRLTRVEVKLDGVTDAIGRVERLIQAKK